MARIQGSIHAPYPALQENIAAGGSCTTALAASQSLIFYCAFGERSAMAVQAAQDAGLTSSTCHIHGGFDAWKRAGGLSVG